VQFLGHIVSGGDICTDPDKVEAITSLMVNNLADLKCFLGASGFYRKFIENYAHVAAPLTDMTRGGVPFIWTEEQQR